ncbi:ras-related protein Rab-22A-like isoform X3 [Haemaphysalis longicornis]
MFQLSRSRWQAATQVISAAKISLKQACQETAKPNSTSQHKGHCCADRLLCSCESVGKTSIITRYAQKKFNGTTSPTIGASFTTLRVNVDNVRVRLQLWDTAGQERFRAMAPLYYRNANAAIVAYDITSSSSFCALQQWVIELTRNVEGPIALILVGNKCDLTEQRAVEKADAQRYARGVGGHFFECSALSNEDATRRGVCQILATLLRALA